MTREIVLVNLAIDTDNRGERPPRPRFCLRGGPRYNRPHEDAPGVIEQFRLGECQVRLEAEWDDEKGDWIFGKRVDDA